VWKVSLFLAHAWARDAVGRDTHERVAKLNDDLNKLGVATWFDREKVKGQMSERTFPRESMSANIS